MHYMHYSIHTPSCVHIVYVLYIRPLTAIEGLSGPRNRAPEAYLMQIHPYERSRDPSKVLLRPLEIKYLFFMEPSG